MHKSILAAHKLTHDIIKPATSAEKSVKSKEVTYVTLNDDDDSSLRNVDTENSVKSKEVNYVTLDSDDDVAISYCLIVPETNTRIRMNRQISK